MGPVVAVAEDSFKVTFSQSHFVAPDRNISRYHSAPLSIDSTARETVFERDL